MGQESIPSPSTLLLVGDELEQLYQLGHHDRERHEELHGQVRHFLSTPYPLVDKAAQKLGHLLVRHNFEHHQSFRKRIEAYSEGLNIDPEQVALITLIPELVSSLSKWIPGLPRGLMGCSSLFSLDHKTGELMHGRILDFPVQDSFDRHERLLRTQTTHHLKAVSLGSVGLPFHAVTSMNEAGVSLALHQKFTDVFHPQGESIFNLAHELILNVSNSKEALKFLKNHHSITTWCLYLGFSREGRVLEVDVMGDKLVHQIHEVTPNDVLYFNNDLVKKTLRQKPALPLGLAEYNHLRRENGLAKIDKYKKLKAPKAQDLLRMMSTPHPAKTLPKHPIKADQEFDILTPSSVTCTVMLPGREELWFIPGEAPKIYRGEMVEAKNLFDNPQFKIHQKRTGLPDPRYEQGWRHYARAQKYIDSHQLHEAYHHLQMGIAHFENSPWAPYGRFFLNVLEFMHEEHPRIRAHTLGEFRALRDQLSPYLKDQATLFANRLERLLGKPSLYETKDIAHPELKKLFRLEQKIPTPVLHKAVCLLMSPRLDIRDVITGLLRP